MSWSMAATILIGLALVTFIVLAFRKGDQVKPRDNPPPPNDYT